MKQREETTHWSLEVIRSKVILRAKLPQVFVPKTGHTNCILSSGNPVPVSCITNHTKRDINKMVRDLLQVSGTATSNN
jgi:hypothetical protein